MRTDYFHVENWREQPPTVSGPAKTGRVITDQFKKLLLRWCNTYFHTETYSVLYTREL
jgi:hypothetical protein